MYIASILTVALIALVPALTNRAHAQDGGEAGLLDRNTYAQSNRESGIKQALKLSSEQEKLWVPVEEALTNLREQRRAHRASMMAGESANPMERLRRQPEVTSQRADALKKLADAAQPLWATLSEDQKRELRLNLSMAPSRADEETRTSRREDDDVGMRYRHRRESWHYQDQDRADRDRRDQDGREWRDRRDRMMGRRGDDDEDDRDDVRGNRFDRYPRRFSHDDYSPRLRRFERDRYDFDRRSDRDDCRCYRRD